MKYICTEDIENLAAQGKKELVVDENTVLMDLARDTARQLGIAIVDGSQSTLPKAPSPAVPPSPGKDGSPAGSKPPAKAPSSTASAIPSNGSVSRTGAKPKGCQHGPLTVVQRSAPASSHENSDGVVEQLVDLVRQAVGKRTANQDQK